jgi:hypothetical protein
MAKMTLLEIVQEILNDMDSDEVNSIDDTIESQQVANVVKSCYRELIDNRDWPHLRKIITLNPSLDVGKPTHLRIPDNMKELILFKYNKATKSNPSLQMEDVKYLYPDEFLRYQASRKQGSENVLTVTDYSGTNLLILTNRAPSYWTSFDDSHMVCDSYQVDMESTLMASKTQCLAYMDPVWVHRDNAVPDLPSEAFSALTEEAKSTAFLVLKQMSNQKAEQKATRQQRWLSRKAWRTHGGVRYENYGRRSSK